MTVKGPTHRQRQAEATRVQVALAARALFAERGYVATTIADISQASDIPTQTIYSAFRGKAGILAKATELWMAESQTPDLAQQSRDESEPAGRLRIFARLNRSQLETGADLIAVYQEAARADVVMAETLHHILASREREIRALVSSVSDALAEGTSVDHALDLVLALTLSEVYRTLVVERGWSTDAYESWLAETLVSQLLG
jgi:AcrR family transcriptional regulator